MFKNIVRTLYTLLTLLGVGYYAYEITRLVSAESLEIVSLEYLISHGVIFVVALPLFLPMCIKAARLTEKAMIGVALFGVGLLLSPLALIIVTVYSIVITVRGYIDSAPKPDLSLTSLEIYRYSMHRAAEKLLDDNFDEDITVDDGEEIRRYRQIALIEDSEDKYALLCPIDTDDGTAYAFLIDKENGLYTLTHVTDKTLYSRLYRKYKRLLES